MPNYTFVCRQCENEYDKIVPMNERDSQICDCGGETYRRIVFHGTVWSPTSTGAMHK